VLHVSITIIWLSTIAKKEQENRNIILLIYRTKTLLNLSICDFCLLSNLTYYTDALYFMRTIELKKYQKNYLYNFVLKV